MQTTMDLLDELSAKHGDASDYRLAKILKVTKSAVSRYRGGGAFFSDEIAMRVAADLNLEPGYVLACVHAERAKQPAIKAVWEDLAIRVAAAVVLGVGVGGLVATLAPEAAPALLIVVNDCVLC